MDKDEFCACIRRWETSMYALAYSIVKNETDAEEVLSETVFRAWKNLDTLKNEKAFKAWVLRIVHNVAVELIRKNSKLLFVEETADFVRESSENQITDRLALHTAIERLKQPYREVVVLFYYENLSIAKIARIMGSNMGAVKKQLSRARKMLREILKEDFGG